MTLLYSGVELTRAVFGKPLQTCFELGTAALRANPYWLDNGGQELAAMFDLGARISKSYAKPEWKHEQWGFAVEIEHVWETPFGTLTHFAVKNGNDRPKLLIVAPMSGHYPTLLRDTVKTMAHSCDVYITEWANARDVGVEHGDFSLDDYVDFLRESFRWLHKHDARPAHVMSVCQPTVPSLAAAALMHEDEEAAAPASLVMIGGPIDARKSPTATNNFAQTHNMDWFKNSLISVVPMPYAGVGRRVYPGFLQHMGFVAMNPSRHVQAHSQYFDNLVKGNDASVAKHRDFYDEYNAVMDLPEAYYLQTIQKVFKDFDLPHARLELCGRLVKPELIRSRLMTIEGGEDDISGAGQTHSAHGLCKAVKNADRVELTVEGVGHYGVFSGASFKEKIAPQIVDFLQASSKAG